VTTGVRDESPRVAPVDNRSRLVAAATRPVSSASLAVVRIAFGVSMVVNAFLYLPVLVQEYYGDTTYNFPYGELTFVRAVPGAGMHLVYVAMAVAGVCIALGWRYRWAAASFFVLTTYVFLVDSTYFQNHEYLISVLALMFWMLPLGCRWSFDARRDPSIRSAVLPAWMVWFVRFQIGVPYFYGGIAKLNSDWLAGEPLRRWLGNRTEIGPIDAVLTNDGVVWFMTYGALVLDLGIVAALLYRPTRVAGFVVITTFHLLNAWLWGLFIFPWLMIAATTIFFEPDWPERALVHLRARWPNLPWLPVAAGAVTAPPASAMAPTARGPRFLPWRASSTWVLRSGLLAFLGVWMALQLLVPLRHYAIDGSPSWTEQGHRFAWHMKLRDKQGWALFHVTTEDGRTVTVDPRDHLNDKQVARLPGHPERLVQFSRHLSDLHGGAEVRAETSVSLNGRDPQPFVDPTVDLSARSAWWWGHADWILPLEQPLVRWSRE
jgi:vitamin K-dependent gamma-carboxylase